MFSFCVKMIFIVVKMQQRKDCPVNNFFTKELQKQCAFKCPEKISWHFGRINSIVNHWSLQYSEYCTNG